MTALAVFAAQLVYIFLLGFQQLNVQGRHYAGAAVTSLALGVFGYHLIAVVALQAGQPIGSAIWWAYISGGPVGICFAIWIHPRLRRWMVKE